MKVTKREYSPAGVWRHWQWRSVNDLVMNGAFFVESGLGLPVARHDKLKGKPGTYVSRLTRFSGIIRCHPGRPC